MNTKKETAPIEVAFSLSLNGGKPLEIKRTLQIENVPGAWRIHGNSDEIQATDIDVSKAVLAFIGINYSGSKLTPEKVCEAFITTLLERAQPDQIIAVSRAIVETLQR